MITAGEVGDTGVPSHLAVVTRSIRLGLLYLTNQLWAAQRVSALTLAMASVFFLPDIRKDQSHMLILK